MHRAGVRGQVADVLSRLPIDGTDNIQPEDRLSGLVIGSGEKVKDKITSIFALDARSNTPSQSVTKADGTDATLPHLAEFVSAQSGDE